MTSGAEPVEADRRSDAPHPRETPLLFGQNEAEQAFLGAAASGRLHHAWMLTGPEGIGKATLAWHIARHVVSGRTGSALHMDSDAPVFRQAAQLSSPSIFLCRRPWDPQGKRLRKAITIDEVRALKSYFQLSQSEGAWRVAIVDAADELNTASANALLKILEEPPERALLLLVCHSPTRLLPTIRSRCRNLPCKPLGEGDMNLALESLGISTGTSEAAVLTGLSGGSPGRALDLSGAEGAAIFAEITGLLQNAPQMDRRRALRLADSCATRGDGTRFRVTGELIALALHRLARNAAGLKVEPVSEAEAGAMERLGRTRAQARVWAEAAPSLQVRLREAANVNLDPAQVILDTLLRIDAAAGEALEPAA